MDREQLSLTVSGEFGKYRPSVLHLCFEPMAHPNGGLGVHVARVTKSLERYVDQVVINMPAKFEPMDTLIDLGNDRYSALVDKQTGHFISGGGFDVYNDETKFFEAFVKLGHRDFDIIHCHDTYFYGLAEKLRMLFGSKIICTSHLLMADVVGMFKSHAPKAHFQIENEVRAYHECDAAITISEHYGWFLTQLFGVPEDKVTLVYNGIDRSNSVTANPKVLPKTIGFLGRAAYMKGIHFVRDAIKALPEMKWVIITNSSDEANYQSAKDFINFCHAQQNIEVVEGKHPDEKWAHMAKCDLAIMPSVREPWGLVALEWMQAGVPLIGAQIGGLAEIVDESRAWPFNHPNLIKAILDYRYDPMKVSRAKEFADSFTWDNCADGVYEVYKKCLQKS
jgi:glycosyltransferase involved in cell wall biosynthesis